MDSKPIISVADYQAGKTAAPIQTPLTEITPRQRKAVVSRLIGDKPERLDVAAFNSSI